MKTKLIALAIALMCAISCSSDPMAQSRRLVESGDKYMAQKNIADATVQYRNAVAKDGSSGEARYKLAVAYEALGDRRNALREHVRAADLMPGNIDAQLHAGRMLLMAGQFPEAKARALAALAKDPKNVEGLVLMGNALAGLKDLDGAIQQIEQAIDQDPRRTLSYTNLGLLQAGKGNGTAAEAALKRAVAVDPKSPSVHMSLANYYWAAGQPADAERALLAAAALAPRGNEINKTVSAFYLSFGKTREAEQYLKAYAETAPEIGPRLILADFYLSADRTKDAVAVLERISSEKGGFGPAKVRLATVAFKSGAHPAAYQTLEDVLKAEPKDEAALEMKARFLIDERKFDEALKISDSVIARNPQARASYYLRGVSLEATGANSEAVKSYQQLLQIDPAAVPAQVRLAGIFLRQGDSNAAVEFLGQVVKTQPTFAVRVLLARALMGLGEFVRAESELSALAKENPSLSEIPTLLGNLYWAKGDAGRAREAYGRALQLKGDSVPALTGLVSAEIVDHKPDVARARVESRLAKSPRDPNLLILAGNVYMSTGAPDKAIQAFEKAMQSDPGNLEAYNRLGAVYVEQQRLDDARKNYEEASQHLDKPVATLTMLGVILERQNKRDEARKRYEQALAIEPGAVVAANNLAWSYADTGENLAVALQLAQAAKAGLPNSAEVSDTLGWIYLKKGLAGLAVTSLLEAAQQAPKNPMIHYHLGVAYLRNGSRAEAQKALQQALKLNPTFEGAGEATRLLATIKG